MRTGRSAHPGTASRLRGARTSSSAFRPGSASQCGPGGPRTPAPHRLFAVRGRPRPHPGPGSASQCGPGGPRHGTAPSRRADVPVRIPAWLSVPMRTGRSAHPGTASRLRGARTSPSAFRPGSASQCGPGGPRTPARRRLFAVRGRPRPHSGLAQSPNADREVRAPRHGLAPSRCADVLVRIPAWLSVPMRTGRSAHPGTASRLRGARTSSSAFRPGSASQCGPGGPRTPARRGAFAVRGRPRPYSGLAQRPNADREVRAPRHGIASSRCADVPVRIPGRHEVQCGPGGPAHPGTASPLRGARTSPSAFRPGSASQMRTGRSAHPGTASALRGARTSSSAFRPGSASQCGPGGPRTPARRRLFAVRGRPRPHSGPAQRPNADREVRAPRHGVGSSRCADVLVRIPSWLRVTMRTGRSAHPGTAPHLRGARTSSSAFRPGSESQCGPGGPRTPGTARRLRGARTSSSAIPP